MLKRKQQCQQIEHPSLQKSHSKEMVAQQDYYRVWINREWIMNSNDFFGLFKNQACAIKE